MIALNERAWQLFEQLSAKAAALNCRLVDGAPGGARVIDAGIDVPGSIDAGQWLAEICLAGLGEVAIVQNPRREFPASASAGARVVVDVPRPVCACMASQYAGWKLSHGKFFAMGSGPMRAAAGQEEIFSDIGFREESSRVVGVLESRKLPPAEIVEQIAGACRVAPNDVALVVAPTASPAGTVQIVARSVETALHKLHTLGFDLSRIEHGHGEAPLPPVAPDDFKGIGWTNDAILYGGAVELAVRGDDAELAELVARVPSSASSDFGRPFAEIFESYGGDFYRIDPMLFSPARIRLKNLDSGRVHEAGRMLAENTVWHS